MTDNSKETIFISVASYSDGMLFFTLNDAMAKATRPELLSFAVVDQNPVDQRGAIAALPYARQIRHVHIDQEDTLGVSWARNIAFSLYDGEAFLLQIDSHTLFEPGWDDTLRNQHKALLARSSKPIVTVYPYGFDMTDGKPVPVHNEEKTTLVLRPHPEKKLTPEDAVMRFKPMHLFTDGPVVGCHIAGGFLFAAGSFVEEVPYDPYLYFHGEEQSLAVRAFTHGWDIFHLSEIPLYHMYNKEGATYLTHHWHGAADARRAFPYAHLLERAKQRLNRLLMGDGLPGAYGLGKVRTMDQYRELSGIDYRTHQITDPFNGQLC